MGSVWDGHHAAAEPCVRETLPGPDKPPWWESPHRGGGGDGAAGAEREPGIVPIHPSWIWHCFTQNSSLIYGRPSSAAILSSCVLS